MKKVRVAILCGGPSNEHEISLRSGAQIGRALDRNKYIVRTLAVPKEPAKIAPALTAGLRSTDLALIALHGRFGEDGKIQALLEMLGVPYTGSGVLASALGMDKVRTSTLATSIGLRVPKSLIITLPRVSKQHSNILKNVWMSVRKQIGFPCVVKPNESGSSVGVSIVRAEPELERAFALAAQEDSTLIVQQHVAGRELTCGVMGNVGQGKPLALPPVEIIPGETFFDYEAKYNSPKTQEICPARIPKTVERAMAEQAIKIHTALGCDGLTRSDFILGKDNKLYFLEINTIPGMTAASLCPKEAAALGWSFQKFLDKIIGLAFERRRR